MRGEPMTCAGCGTPEPPWPYRWRFLDDGAALCPVCRDEVTPLRPSGRDNAPATR